jgi:hypothetical protein
MVLKPALVDERHAGALRFLGHQVTRLALGADHQDGAAVGGQLADVAHRLVVLREGDFQVDDMNLVAVTEDVRGHLGVPETGLVAEMDTGFQHFTHGDRHV